MQALTVLSAPKVGKRKKEKESDERKEKKKHKHKHEKRSKEKREKEKKRKEDPEEATVRILTFMPTHILCLSIIGILESVQIVTERVYPAAQGCLWQIWHYW